MCEFWCIQRGPTEAPHEPSVVVCAANAIVSNLRYASRVLSPHAVKGGHSTSAAEDVRRNPFPLLVGAFFVGAALLASLEGLLVETVPVAAVGTSAFHFVTSSRHSSTTLLRCEISDLAREIGHQTEREVDEWTEEEEWGCQGNLRGSGSHRQLEFC